MASLTMTGPLDIYDVEVANFLNDSEGVANGNIDHLRRGSLISI